ncbi:MAG TPA: AAA family ATPase [Methanocorpusculum sp.]|nr:AAA family ATPase [Methanocorpusculum sp.]
MRIGIAGSPGSGTTTLGKHLAEKFGLSFYSGGSFFREAAAERNMTLAEFGELAKQNPDIDHEVDRRQTQFAIDNDNIIIESRLVGWMVNNADLMILLSASQKCRSERIAEREGISPEESYRLTVEREKCEADRYREYYQIDITSHEPYDLILNTEKFSAEEVFAIASAAVESLKKL